MGRWRPRVIYPSDGSDPAPAGAPNTQPPDAYLEQVVKHIPAEAITAYQGVAGLLTVAPSDEKDFWLRLTAVACLIFTPVWILFATREAGEPPAWSQATVGILAFAVWLLAINSPAVGLVLHNWNEFKGSIILILMTTLAFPLLGRILRKMLGA